jgi:hypothetical protein
MKFSKTTQCFYPDDIAYPNPPADLIEVTSDDYTAAMNRAPDETLDVVDGKLVIVPAPIPDSAQLQVQARANMKIVIQAFVDAPAVALGFSGGDSLMLYAGFKNDFQALAQKFGQWEAKTWVYAEGVEADFKAGKRAVPSADELIAELPKFEGYE